jgi:NAD-dependent dihydropyrimidine dehydrogenase PreA subunit
MRNYVRILVLAVLVALGGIATVQALPAVGHDTVYYYDAGYGDYAGESYWDCYGYHFMDGVQTDYFNNDEWSCSSGGYECYRLGYTSDGGHMCYWDFNSCIGCAGCVSECGDYQGHG